MELDDLTCEDIEVASPSVHRSTGSRRRLGDKVELFSYHVSARPIDRCRVEPDYGMGWGTGMGMG